MKHVLDNNASYMYSFVRNMISACKYKEREKGQTQKKCLNIEILPWAFLNNWISRNTASKFYECIVSIAVFFFLIASIVRWTISSHSCKWENWNLPERSTGRWLVKLPKSIAKGGPKKRAVMITPETTSKRIFIDSFDRRTDAFLTRRNFS